MLRLSVRDTVARLVTIIDIRRGWRRGNHYQHLSRRCVNIKRRTPVIAPSTWHEQRELQQRATSISTAGGAAYAWRPHRCHPLNSSMLTYRTAWRKKKKNMSYAMAQ